MSKITFTDDAGNAQDVALPPGITLAVAPPVVAPPAAPTLTGQTLTADKAEIHVGDTFTVLAVLNYSDGTTKPAGWHLYGFDKKLVTCPNEYTPTFTALAPGTTTIKNDNSKTTGTLAVTVLAAAGAPPPPPPPPSNGPPENGGVPPFNPPPAVGAGTHVAQASFTDKTKKTWYAAANVGDDLAAAGVWVHFADSDGNDHPGVSMMAYANGCEIGAMRCDNAFGYLNIPALTVTYDGTHVDVVSSKADGTFDFPRGCANAFIEYGKPAPWSADNIDKTLLPNYAPGQQAPFDDSKKKYGFNGLGLASMPGMDSGGDRVDIGYLPTWVTAFLTNPCDATWAVMWRADKNDGAWPIFFRRADTGGILDINTYPGASMLSYGQAVFTGNPIVAYGGDYDGDTLIPPVLDPNGLPAHTTSCPNSPNIAHLTGYGFVSAMVTHSARDRDHASFWGNYVCIGENPSYFRSRGVVLNRPQRYFAWGLRSLFMAAYVSSDCDYFSKHVDDQLTLVNTVPQNPYGIADTFCRGDASPGFDGYAMWMEDYVTTTLDAVAFKRPEWKPYAKYLASFVPQLLIDENGQPRSIAPLATSYVWSYRKTGEAACLAIPDQYAATLLDSWTTDEISAITTPGLTAQQVHDQIAAHYKRLNQGWAGQCVNGVCDFMQYVDAAGAYPALIRSRAAVAMSLGCDNADAAWAYCESLPTKPDFSKDWRFNLIPRAA